MSTTDIDTLTAEQEAAIPAHVARWVAAGLSTEPANKPTAEDALRRMYGYAGLDAPTILWASNPDEMARLLAGLDTGRPVWGAVTDAVWGAVTDAVWDAVTDAVWDAVVRAVRNAVTVAVRDAVTVAVRDAVWDAAPPAVTVAVRDAVRDAARDAVRAVVVAAYDGGQPWAAWPAMESYLREVCGLTLPGDLSERGRVLADYRASVGPGLWFERVAILCERPASFTPLTWRTTT